VTFLIPRGSFNAVGSVLKDTSGRWLAGLGLLHAFIVEKIILFIQIEFGREQEMEVQALFAV
jgi:hypothetical protein